MSNIAIAIIITTNHRIKARQINEKIVVVTTYSIFLQCFFQITPTY